MRKFVLQFGATLIGALATISVANAQLYTAPNVNSATNLFTTPPTVNSHNSNLALQRLNSAYGGLRSPLYNPAYQSDATGAGRIGLGIGQGSRASKPFAGVSSSPTVSPYLNLFRTDLEGGNNFNYSTLVQPQLQQQQVNQQLERQTTQTNRRLQSIAAQSDYNPQGSKDEYPTGHQTVFNYMGHYFPSNQVRPKRQHRQQ